MLQVKFEERGGVLFITPLAARLDATVAPAFRDSARELAHGRSLVVVSMSQVNAIDASGAAALVSILKRMAPGGELRLAGASPTVRSFLSELGLDELFPAFEDAAPPLPA